MSFAGDWTDATHVLPAGSAGGLKGLLDRLEEVIDAENAALRSRDAIDLVETNRRKSRSLLELSRAARSLQASPDHAIRNQLQRVRVKLQQNYDLLGLYLAAAQEVTDILGDALRDAESDGTYSAALGSGHGSR